MRISSIWSTRRLEKAGGDEQAARRKSIVMAAIGSEIADSRGSASTVPTPMPKSMIQNRQPWPVLPSGDGQVEPGQGEQSGEDQPADEILGGIVAFPDGLLSLDPGTGRLGSRASPFWIVSAWMNALERTGRDDHGAVRAQVRLSRGLLSWIHWLTSW